MNLPVLVIGLLAAAALIVFLIIRNQKDKKELEEKLNNDYTRPQHDKEDVETEDDFK